MPPSNTITRSRVAAMKSRSSGIRSSPSFPAVAPYVPPGRPAGCGGVSGPGPSAALDGSIQGYKPAERAPARTPGRWLQRRPGIGCLRMTGARVLRRTRRSLPFALALLAAAVPRASATTFVADRLTDNQTNGCALGGCTLREAVLAANVHAGADVVAMTEGRYVLQRAGTGEDAGQTGDLDLRGPLTITGEGAKKTFIDAQPIGISAPDSGDRVFDLHGGDVTVRGIRMDNSEVRGDGGAIRAVGHGSLLLRGTGVGDATAARGRGGGIFTQRGYSLRLVESRVDNDHAGRSGGGISPAGKRVVTKSAVDDNHAGGTGGSIFAAGRTEISRSAIHDSEARSFGGAIGASGRLTLRSSVVSDS